MKGEFPIKAEVLKQKYFLPSRWKCHP
jgi:hypothetical protein